MPPRRPSSSRRRTGWTLLLVHALIIQVVAYSIRPAATYKALEQGLSPAFLGLMSAAYAFAPLVLAVPVGRLIDRRGERGPLICGGLLLAGASALMWLAPDHWTWLAVSLAAFGTAHLVCVVGEQTIVGRLSGTQGSDSTRGFSTYTLVTSIGQAAGPLLLAAGGTRAARPDLDAVLATTTALTVLALTLTPFLGSWRTPALDEPGAQSSWHLLRDRQLRAAIIVSGIVMAVLDILIVYLPALATERGYSAAFVGAVLSARALASMGVRTLVPRLVRLAGRRGTLGTGIVVAGGGFLLLVTAPWSGAVAVAVILIGAGLGVSQPLTMSLVSDLAPTGSRALAMSLRISGNRLGVLLLPAAVGLLFAGAGAVGALAAAAGALGCGAAVAMRDLEA